MATRRYLNNKVATSSFLLPVAIVLSLLLWLSQGISNIRVDLGLVACLSCTALMMELNNANVLIRVRSRMVSATFIVLWSVCVFLRPVQWAHLAALCLILAYHSLFRAYQHTNATAEAFNAFLCIGVSTIVAPPLLLLAVPFMVSFAWFQAMSLRAFFAMLLGLVVPFWIVAGTAFLTDSFTALVNYVNSWLDWSVSDYGKLNVFQVAMGVLLLLLDLIAGVHTLGSSFKDKIKTRVLYYFISWMTFALFLMLAAFPRYYDTILALVIVTSSPLIAHFYTLACHKLVGILFIFTLVILAAIALSNIWMPSFQY